MDSESYDAMISYATEDQQDFVEPLVRKLQSEGFRIWYDKDYVLTGDLLRDKIDKAIRNSRAAKTDIIY